MALRVRRPTAEQVDALVPRGLVRCDFRYNGLRKFQDPVEGSYLRALLERALRELQRNLTAIAEQRHEAQTQLTEAQQIVAEWQTLEQETVSRIDLLQQVLGTPDVPVMPMGVASVERDIEPTKRGRLLELETEHGKAVDAQQGCVAGAEVGLAGTATSGGAPGSASRASGEGGARGG